MNGQAHHFLRYAPEGQDYGVTRYVREVVRLLNVLEYRLAEADYLGGSDYSIADMAAWPWVQASWLPAVDLASFPAVSRWSQAIAARQAVFRAARSGATAIPAGNTQDRARLSEDPWSHLFGARLKTGSTTRQT